MPTTSHNARGRAAVAALIAVAVILAAMAMMTRPANAGVAYAVGDVFASVGGGKVLQFSNTGTLKNTLDSTHAGAQNAGMCFDAAGNLYDTMFATNTLSKFDNQGNVTAASFGSGYSSDPESCSFNGNNQIYVGQADGTHKILKFDTAGNPLASYTVAVDQRGTDWIDLAADQCTMLYAGEGNLIKRFNVCTNTQLTDFKSGLTGPCFAVRIRTNGEVMVACQTKVYRMDSSGTILNTYNASALSPASTFLFAMNLDPDGTTYWTADINTGDIYRVNLATGAQVTHFKATLQGALGGLAVFGEQRAAVQPTPSPSPSVAASVAGLPKAGANGTPASATGGVEAQLALLLVLAVFAGAAVALWRPRNGRT